MKAQIYALTTEDGTVFYIGRSKSAENRFYQHILSAKRKETPTHRKIHSLGGKVKFLILEEITGADKFFEREKYWIDFYSKKGKLTNTILPVTNKPSGSVKLSPEVMKALAEFCDSRGLFISSFAESAILREIKTLTNPDQVIYR